LNQVLRDHLAAHSPRPRQRKFASAREPYKLDQRLGEARVSELIRRYEAGETSRQLAAAFGLGASSVKELLHRRGAKVRHKVGLTSTQVDTAVALYQDGWLLREIGKKFEVSRDAVRLALRERGVVLRSGHGNHGRRIT
jgi:uncharacterized protein (DUF433 family)